MSVVVGHRYHAGVCSIPVLSVPDQQRNRTGRDTGSRSIDMLGVWPGNMAPSPEENTMSKDMCWLHAIAYLSLSHMMLHDGGPATTLWDHIEGICGIVCLAATLAYIVLWLWPEEKQADKKGIIIP